jgi:hypothetical protein
VSLLHLDEKVLFEVPRGGDCEARASDDHHGGATVTHAPSERPAAIR